MISRISIFITLAAVLFPTHVTHAADLRAGVAVVDITPPIGYRMSGYFFERPSTGIHDPLQAKAVVFRQGETAAALVFCDLIGLSPQVTAEARKRASDRTGIPAAHISVMATHTHIGPLYFGALRNMFHDAAVAKHGEDPLEKVDYPALLTDRVAQAIEKADKAVKPVRLESLVAKQEGLSFNRRFHMKDGTVRFNPGKLNPDIVRVAGPIDPDVPFVLIRDARTNKPIASLTVFALHLDTVGGTEYGADFPYYLELSLRNEFGPQFVSLFGAGTCGDINHINVSNRDRQKGQEEAKRIGEALAATIKSKLDELKSVNASLAAAGETIDVPLQKYSAEKVAWAKRMMAQVGSGAVPFLARVEAYKITALQERGGDSIPIEVQALRLGDELAIVTLPAEVFVDLGLAIKKASPFRTTIVIELANDAPGYIPTTKAFAEGSYETVNSRVAPGGGEAMVEAAGRVLERVEGR